MVNSVFKILCNPTSTPHIGGRIRRTCDAPHDTHATFHTRYVLTHRWLVETIWYWTIRRTTATTRRGSDGEVTPVTSLGSSVGPGPDPRSVWEGCSKVAEIAGNQELLWAQLVSASLGHWLAAGGIVDAKLGQRQVAKRQGKW